MTEQPENARKRLNKELWRYRLGGWKVWAISLPVIALFILVFVPEPRDFDHRTGTVTGVSTLPGKYGPIIRIGVDLDGTLVEAGTPARILAPADGEVICVRHAYGKWTGIQTFRQTDMRFCDGSIPTPGVE